MVIPELKRAQLMLAIQDVYACEVNAWADRSLEPADVVSNVVAQFRVNDTGDVQVVEIAQPAPFHFLVKYFISTGLRLLKSGVDPNQSEIRREDLLGEISATFVVRYINASSEAPTQSMLAAFSENAIHHMWPYWREFLQSATARFRLPAVMLPMRIIQPPPTPDTPEANDRRPGE